MKTCSKCGETKPKPGFSKCTKNKDGLSYWCKGCASDYAKTDNRKASKLAYRLANVSNAAAYHYDAAYHAEYRLANTDKRAAYNKAYNLAHRDYQTKYRLDNADKRRAYYAANKEKIAAQRLERDRSNPEKSRIYAQNYSARKRQAGGTLSKGLAVNLFKLQKGKCPCCGNPLGKDYHMDHKKPLALGGANTDDNIQLLRSTCNVQKGAKDPIDFMQSKGFLL